MRRRPIGAHTRWICSREQKARKAVLAIYETATDAEALRRVALEAFTGLPYKKTSPFYRAPGNAAKPA